MWLFYFILSFIFGIWLLSKHAIGSDSVGQWIIVIVGALVGGVCSANILTRKK